MLTFISIYSILGVFAFIKLQNQFHLNVDHTTFGAVAAFCDSGAVYKCHDLLTYLYCHVRYCFINY